MTILDAGPLALSLDLHFDRLTVVVFDLAQQLKSILSHTIDFDRVLSSFQTRNGVYAQADLTSLTSIELIIAALDFAFDWLHSVQPPATSSSSIPSVWPLPARIVSISLTSESMAPVFLSDMAGPLLSSLSPSLDLRSQLCYDACFTLPLTPNEKDRSAIKEARDLQCAIFVGSECNQRERPYFPSQDQIRQAAAEKAGSPVTANGWMAQLLIVKRRCSLAQDGRDNLPSDAWHKTDRIVTLPGLLSSILAGKVAQMSPTEASLTGMLNNDGAWDDGLLQFVATLAPAQPYDKPLKDLLGPISDDLSPLGTIGNYFVERYGVNRACLVTSPLPSHVASYLSFLPAKNDAGLHLGLNDTLIVPTASRTPAQEGALIVNPLAKLEQDSSTDTAPSSYLRVVTFPSSDQIRQNVRDAYGNASWRTFGKCMGFVPVGGSIGMDNKFFSIWRPDISSMPLQRYEGGIIVPEFSDLRANPRCLIEGQAMATRAIFGRIATKDRAERESKGKEVLKRAAPLSTDFATGKLGTGQALGFDPYDLTLTPERILAWGEVASNEAIAQCWANVLGGRWVIPTGEHELLAAKGACFFALATIEAQQARTHGDRSFQGFAPFIRSLLGGSAAFSPPVAAESPSLPSSHFSPPSSTTVPSSPPPNLFPGGRLRSSSSPLVSSLGSDRFTSSSFNLVIPVHPPHQTGFSDLSKSPSAISPTAAFSSVIGGEPFTPPSSPLSRRLPRRTSNLSVQTHGSSSLHVLDEGEEDGAGGCATAAALSHSSDLASSHEAAASTPRPTIIPLADATTSSSVGEGSSHSPTASLAVSRRKSLSVLAWDPKPPTRSASTSTSSSSSSSVGMTRSASTLINATRLPSPVIGRPRAGTDAGIRSGLTPLSTIFGVSPTAEEQRPMRLSDDSDHDVGAGSSSSVGVIGSARTPSSAGSSPTGIRRFSSASPVLSKSMAMTMSPASPSTESETATTHTMSELGGGGGAAVVGETSDEEEKRMRAWLRGHANEPKEEESAAATGELSDGVVEEEGHGNMDVQEEEQPHSTTTTIRLLGGRRSIVPSAYDRLEALRALHRRNEELLGLTQLAEVDEDLWIIYGALVEEYVRLRCAGRPLGSPLSS